MNQPEPNQAREEMLNLVFSKFELPTQCTEPGCKMLYDFAEPKNKSLCYWHRNQPKECAFTDCTTREMELNHGLCSEHAKGLLVTFSPKSSRMKSTSTLERMYGVRGAKPEQRSGLSLQPRELTATEFDQGNEVIKGMTPRQRKMASSECAPLFPPNKIFRNAEGDQRRMCTIVWAILSGNYVIKNAEQKATGGQRAKEYAG